MRTLNTKVECIRKKIGLRKNRYRIYTSKYHESISIILKYIPCRHMIKTPTH